MRQFGAEHLQEAGRTDQIAERHARWCLEEVSAIRDLLSGRAEIEGVVRLSELWPNLRAAFDFAIATEDRELAHALLRPIAAEIYLRSQSEIGDWAERLLAITPREDQELIVFGVTWAARRYMRTADQAGFEQLVDRFGEPDDPLIAYARAFLYSDRDGLVEAAPKALAALRDRGDGYDADLFEVAALAFTLLTSGQLAELDRLGAEQVERFRTDGPPTCLSWALAMLGFSASLQGRHGDSWELLAESANVEVPARTHSLRNPLEARAAFRRGNTLQALRRLSAYVEDVIDNDNMYLAGVACGEFIHMMMNIGRQVEAARVLGHLSSVDSAAAASPDLLADTERRLEIDPDGLLAAERVAGAEMNGRQTLDYIRDVLVQLIEECDLVS